MTKIHFHSRDDRFCGSTRQMRQFSFDPNAVTCPHCRAKDTFVLSPEAAAYVARLEADRATQSATPEEAQ